MASESVRDFPCIKEVKTFIIQGALDCKDITLAADTVQVLGLAAITTTLPANIGLCPQRLQRQCLVRTTKLKGHL